MTKERFIEILTEIYDYPDQVLRGSMLAPLMIDKLGDEFETCGAQSHEVDFQSILQECYEEHRLLDPNHGHDEMSSNYLINDWGLIKSIKRNIKINELLDGQSNI